MRVRSPGDDGKNSSDPNFRALLDRPLQAVELENGEDQRDLRSAGLALSSRLRCFRVEREFDPIMGNRRDRSATNVFSGCDVKLLPNLRPQHASEMRGMLTNQNSGVSVNFVGDPAASCHGTGVRRRALSLKP